ncbi:MAG: type II toxin-antitoxin system PemK/MazF family toxin [Candidatus Riflebacteria bacterium]|nr:type II toxin-antitoxin system PemK/MazF family toxin [Candidatus Riflebacteria bacterium]
MAHACRKLTVGHEIAKTRPALVVSPDEMNRTMGTVIVAPMTSQGRPLPTRIPCHFQKKQGHVVLDQLRTIDRVRLVRRLGALPSTTLQCALATLVEMFEPQARPPTTGAPALEAGISSP